MFMHYLLLAFLQTLHLPFTRTWCNLKSVYHVLLTKIKLYTSFPGISLLPFVTIGRNFPCSFILSSSSSSLRSPWGAKNKSCRNCSRMHLIFVLSSLWMTVWRFMWWMIRREASSKLVWSLDYIKKLFEQRINKLLLRTWLLLLKNLLRVYL